MSTEHPLRAWRIQKKLGLREFADLAGCSFPTISKIENGEQNPSFELLCRIVEATGNEVSADMLVAAAARAA